MGADRRLLRRRNSDETGLDVLASQVLHASHHGSRTFVKDNKDDEPWLQALEAIDPEKVVISVGDGNRHDHPHEDMVEIYEEKVGAENVLETMSVGTLVLTVTGEGTYGLEPDANYAKSYGWDDEGGSEQREAGKSSGGGGAAAGRGRLVPHRRGTRNTSASATP